MKDLATLRGIGAIVAGILVVVVLSSATDALMHGTGVFPAAGLPMSDWQWGVSMTYRLCYTIVGGLTCANLASARPIAHAVVLGVVGTCIGTIGAVTTWSLGPEFGPKWFQILLAATALPSCWLGAKWFILLRSVRSEGV